jgi:exoribonuclease-2
VLPRAPVQAFSIDDSATTEIDDALSVQGLGSGTVVVGIHIAAPALALTARQPDRPARAHAPVHGLHAGLQDHHAARRAVVQAYTLQEGRDCPAVSLYLTLDETTLEVRRSARRAWSGCRSWPICGTTSSMHWSPRPGCRTRRMKRTGPRRPRSDHPATRRGELSFLYRLACHLKAAREVVRGKPETFNRPDYNFRLDGNDGAEPDGTEQVRISVRQRGAPLDLIVAEAMILANSYWGAWMADMGVPAIYRSQASLAPGVKVRMGTKALPHAGIGVPCYAWSTSPLRRYTDLVNQWQIIACARHGKTAALVAPFKPKDAELFSIISAFDAAYSAYNGYQGAMERFWTLKYLQQTRHHRAGGRPVQGKHGPRRGPAAGVAGGGCA